MYLPTTPSEKPVVSRPNLSPIEVQIFHINTFNIIINYYSLTDNQLFRCRRFSHSEAA